MSDLIERLEKATGADRLLDALLDIALDKGCPAWAQDTGQLTPDGDCVRVSPTGAGWYPPRYTASIDIAMTLVPDGFAADVSRYTSGSGDARLWQGDRHVGPYGTSTWLGDVRPASPAIALCIVALKARAIAAGHTEQGKRTMPFDEPEDEKPLAIQTADDARIAAQSLMDYADWNLTCTEAADHEPALAKKTYDAAKALVEALGPARAPF